MSATQDRQTRRRNDGAKYSFALGVEKVYAGTIAMLNTAGYAIMGAATGTLKILGVFNEQKDNSAGSAGDLSAEVITGEFRFENSAGADEVTLADIGKVVYVVDNETVAKTSNKGARPVGGICTDIDDYGVWVKMLPGISDDAFVIQMSVADLTSASALVYEAVAPKAFDIEYAFSILEGGALAVGNATIQLAIGAVDVTDGLITIAQASSAAGDVDDCVPSAAKSGAAGARIKATVGGTNTAARAAKLFLVCKPQ